MPDASKRVMGPIPERPSASDFQKDSTSLPTGVMTPVPVTTTTATLRSFSSGHLILLRAGQAFSLV